MSALEDMEQRENLPSKLMSRRGVVSLQVDTFSATLHKRMKNVAYHKVDNPTGIINMGTAVNRLMEKEIQERLMKGDCLNFSSNVQHYYDFSGTEKFRTALSAFFGRHFNPIEEIPSDELVVMNGVTSCLDALGHALCDPGDVIISPTPVYGRIFTDFTDRSGVVVRPLHLSHEADEDGNTFKLTSEALDNRIQQLVSSGDKVRAFCLLNPNNPLGEIYPPELVTEIAQVCAKHEIHLIIDEIYALSIIDPNIKFVSSLSLSLPDPERTHFLWGFSKDFGLAGFRAGIVYCKNKDILKCLKVVGIYQATSSLVHQAMTTLINDIEWCDNFFIPTNQMKLRTTYQKACLMLESEGITVRKSQGGFFMWVHIAPYLEYPTEECEMKLFEEIFEAGLYIVPGTKLFTKPGWFRIIFPVSEAEIEIGLGRLIKVLKSHCKK